ncbi:hypothetical protein FXO38_00058 [Capsicum annuum]|uniref:Uncharacterized protein n=1 Tax=Capsicum annuum TaxID=4072 RepID=A0A2G3A227_CAPAN|nr:hypothetical protein FXO38_00058 [Capsicum annuum]PHT88250.1 hypothetical protein T459_10356 [Capsicum annuum]
MLRGLIDFAAEPIPTRCWCGSSFHLLCEDAQEDYCREECDKGKRVMSLSRGLENECSESKLHAPAKVFQSSMPPKKRGKFFGGHSINWEKEVHTGKTRYVPIAEALGLSSGTKCDTGQTREHQN